MDIKALQALIDRAHDDAVCGPSERQRNIPPVERWNPPFCGDLDMEIRADGSWYYMGTPIARRQMVRLFSTVLRKDDDGRTYLVTPVEKVGIRVVDAPFLAVEMQTSAEGKDQVLTFRTNVGDIVEAGPATPIRFATEAATGGLKPYLLVRGRLEALLTRAVTHELIALGEEVDMGGETMLAVRSSGAIFPICSVASLAEGAS